MKKIIFSIGFIILLIIFLQSCKMQKLRFWDTENAKIHQCLHQWDYKDTETNFTVIVLKFVPEWEYDLSWSRAFLVGVNTTGDTIALLFDHPPNLRKGDRISIATRKFDMLDFMNGMPNPGPGKRRKREENNLYCTVHSAYFVKSTP